MGEQGRGAEVGMTEAEWLACTDPEGMLLHLTHANRPSVRKGLLFVCGCCRRLWRWICAGGK